MRPLDPCGLGAVVVLARFHVMADKWASFEALPDDLDLAQAVMYEETEDAPAPRLGYRFAVWPDQVWQQRPNGSWQRAVATAADLEGTPSRWVRVTA